MTSKVWQPLVLLAFGLVALVGLIVLAALHDLSDAVQATLTSIAVGSLTGAAGVTIPQHIATDATLPLEPMPVDPADTIDPAAVDVAQPTLASGAG